MSSAEPRTCTPRSARWPGVEVFTENSFLPYWTAFTLESPRVENTDATWNDVGGKVWMKDELRQFLSHSSSALTLWDQDGLNQIFHDSNKRKNLIDSIKKLQLIVIISTEAYRCSSWKEDYSSWLQDVKNNSFIVKKTKQNKMIVSSLIWIRIGLFCL